MSLMQTRAEIAFRDQVPININNIAERMFERFDRDDNDAIDIHEAHHMFRRLLKEGRIQKLPTPAQIRMLRNLAGDDHMLQLDEFNQGVKAFLTAKAQKTWEDEEDQEGSLEIETQSGAGEHQERIESDVRSDSEPGHDLSHIVEMLFKVTDTDGNKVVDPEEAETMFTKLVAKGKLPRMPTPDESNEIVALAGEDGLLQQDEFGQVVTWVWREKQGIPA